jgi:hypothetical protein
MLTNTVAPRHIEAVGVGLDIAAPRREGASDGWDMGEDGEAT